MSKKLNQNFINICTKWFQIKMNLDNIAILIIICFVLIYILQLELGIFSVCIFICFLLTYPLSGLYRRLTRKTPNPDFDNFPIKEKCEYCQELTGRYCVYFPHMKTSVACKKCFGTAWDSYQKYVNEFSIQTGVKTYADFIGMVCEREEIYWKNEEEKEKRKKDLEIKWKQMTDNKVETIMNIDLDNEMLPKFKRELWKVLKVQYAIELLDVKYGCNGIIISSNKTIPNDDLVTVTKQMKDFVKYVEKINKLVH